MPLLDMPFHDRLPQPSLPEAIDQVTGAGVTSRSCGPWRGFSLMRQALRNDARNNFDPRQRQAAAKRMG